MDGEKSRTICLIQKMKPTIVGRIVCPQSKEDSMKQCLSRLTLIKTILIASVVFFLTACSSGPISDEQALEIKDQIEDIRSRLSQIEGTLADLLPADSNIPEDEIAGVRGELDDLRKSLADIQQAIEPPEPKAVPQPPTGTGSPGAPGVPAPPSQPGQP